MTIKDAQVVLCRRSGSVDLPSAAAGFFSCCRHGKARRRGNTYHTVNILTSIHATFLALIILNTLSNLYVLSLSLLLLFVFTIVCAMWQKKEKEKKKTTRWEVSWV